MAPARETRTRLTPAPLPQAPLDDAQRLACLRLIRSDNVGPVDLSRAHQPLRRRRGGARGPARAVAQGRAAASPPHLPARHGRSRAGGRPSSIGARPLFTIEPGYPPALAAVDAAPAAALREGQRRSPVAADGGDRGRAQRLGRRAEARAHVRLPASATAGFVIASGLARGIDAAAHEAALATGTVAVLAGGIDNVYPPENAALAAPDRRAGLPDHGEPAGLRAARPGLSRAATASSPASRMGVLIVEAARRSGTLITARMAGEQGREVFAVPGHPLDPRAEGTNGLLKTGATLVTEPDDISSALAPDAAGGFAPCHAVSEAPVAAASPSWPQRRARPACAMPTAKSCWRRWALRRSMSTSWAGPPGYRRVPSRSLCWSLRLPAVSSATGTSSYPSRHRAAAGPTGRAAIHLLVVIYTLENNLSSRNSQ